MLGRLARDGLHPDQAPDTPIGMWCDAAWSAYCDVILSLDSEAHLDAINQTWDEMIAPAVADAPHESPSDEGESSGRARPTEAERAAWGASAKAQAGAANLAAMMGGPPPRAGGG